VRRKAIRISWPSWIGCRGKRRWRQSEGLSISPSRVDGYRWRSSRICLIPAIIFSPSSTPHPSDIPSPASRRSSFPSSGPSFPPSTGTGSPLREQLIQSNLLAAAIRNDRRYSLNIGAFNPSTPRGMGLRRTRIRDRRLLHQRRDLVAEFRRPQLRVLELDRVIRSMPKLQCMLSSRRMY